ncbi:hypothetical protein ACLBXM_18920 [Xanthobacteraceae bacterium A53D]
MSSNVVFLDAHRRAEVEERWLAYVASMQRAQSTLAVEDGLEAGRAWRRWLDLFMSPEQRAVISSPVVLTR